jgi:hypothetical protein
VNIRYAHPLPSRGATVERDSEGGVIARGVIINSDSRASDGHIVRSAGLVSEDFDRNPVVQFGHGYTSASVPVVGRGENLTLTRTPAGVPANAADIVFARATEFARDVAGLWAEGMLHATSIGWTDDGPDSVRLIDPEGKPVEHEDAIGYFGMLPTGYGVEYMRWRLREFSIVPVPANPDAVRRIRATPSVYDACRQMGLVSAPASIVVPEMRIGKVLSGANVRKVEDAITAIDAARSALGALLEAAIPPASQEEILASPDEGRSLAVIVTEAAARLTEDWT